MSYEKVQILIAVVILFISFGMWYTLWNPMPALVGFISVFLIFLSYFYHREYEKCRLEVNICPGCMKFEKRVQKYCPVCGKKFKK